jgi:transmembrane sensor
MSLGHTLVYATQPGGAREITLPDESQVTLSDSTEVSVLFTEHRRYVLLKKGEALFKVKHDPRAPFQVDAGNRRITDLGTAFDVRRYSDEVVVSVTEGSVSVTPVARDVIDDVSDDPGAQSVASTPSPRIEIKAGEQLSYTATGEITLPHPVDAQAVTSWLYGHRVYRGQPLSKVIQDVQLYTPRSIELDPGIANVRYSGYLDQRQAEEWVRGLPTIYPVDIDDSDPHLLTVRCRSASCPELRARSLSEP